MSLRNNYLGSIVKPGFNPLGAQSLLYNLYGWGSNSSGQIGVGNTTNYSSPVQVGALTTWLTISTQYQTTVALKSDGTIWAWGYNADGQLGLGNRTNYSSPKQVGALTNWAQIIEGGNYTMAIKTDGTLWGWGFNGYMGPLGLNNLTSYSSPKQVGSLTNWKTVYSNGGSTYAIKTDGTLWAWGLNDQGQLGLNQPNTTYYSSPKQVGALTTWASLAGGDSFAVALKTDGTLWTWGQGTYGKTGQGVVTNFSSPKQVGALTNWSFISPNTTSSTTTAVKTNGTLWGWGYNNGQIGNGSTTQVSSPVQVGSLTTWLKTYGGPYVTMSIKTDGTLWGTGQNANGQLGDGTTVSKSSPVQIGSSTSWQTISATGSATMGIG